MDSKQGKLIEETPGPDAVNLPATVEGKDISLMDIEGGTVEIKRGTFNTTSPAESPLVMIARLAADPNFDVDKMDRIIQMYERSQSSEKEAAFNDAFAEFKKQCPKIVRRTPDANPKMSVTDSGGRRKTRMYAALEDIAAVVDPYLSAVGLAYDWLGAVVTADGYLTREFVLRHRGGHSRNTCSPPMPIEGTDAWKKLTDRGESGANPMQRAGIADTYARRYSMAAGLGLTTVDEDTDGAGGEPPEPRITKDQVKELNDLIIESMADRVKFLTFLRISNLADLEASRFDFAAEELNKKIKAGQ